MDVLVRRALSRFKGVKNNIVKATDMTKKLIYVKAIDQQNEKLQKMS